MLSKMALLEVVELHVGWRVDLSSNHIIVASVVSHVCLRMKWMASLKIDCEVSFSVARFKELNICKGTSFFLFEGNVSSDACHVIFVL